MTASDAAATARAAALGADETDGADDAAQAGAARQACIDRHWRINRRATAAMLVAWFIVTFVALFFARDLQFSVFGWPFSFWVAAQGSLLVYLLLVWWYAQLMRRLDDASGVAEDD